MFRRQTAKSSSCPPSSSTLSWVRIAGKPVRFLLPPLSSRLPWNGLSSRPTGRPIFPEIHSDPITSLNPVRQLDQFNEHLKNSTYVDMFGWKDLAMDGRTAIRQVALLGIWGNAYLAKTRTGKEAVICKGRPGLRARLPGTRYLRNHPIVQAGEFVIGRKEMLQEAGKATKIAIVTFIAWDITHELLQDKVDMTRLGVTILSDILQAVVSTFAGVIGGVLATIGGGPIVFSFCIIAVFTFVTGAAISALDDQFRLTEKAIQIAKNIEKFDVLHSLALYAELIQKKYGELHMSPMSYIYY